MRKIFIILLTVLVLQCSAIAEDTIENNNTASSAAVEEPIFVESEYTVEDVEVFSEGKFFGLKSKVTGEVIVKPIYTKLVMVGRSGWIVQKNKKFGLIDSSGNVLIKPKFRHVDRAIGRFVKFGNNNDFGIYNEHGEIIIPPVYNSIDLLYGRMFLTYKNFRYGVSDFKGNVLIPNICDDIYMPSRNLMKIKYLGVWYELENVDAEKLALPETITEIKRDTSMGVMDIVVDTGAISGYSILTFSDYLIKLVSSISPAHEETIDDLILSHGVDTIDIIKKFSWVPKYPVTFAQKYYVHVRNPFNGPLSDIRYGLKRKF